MFQIAFPYEDKVLAFRNFIIFFNTMFVLYSLYNLNSFVV